MSGVIYELQEISCKMDEILSFLSDIIRPKEQPLDDPPAQQPAPKKRGRKKKVAT
jgi:formate dehydrogenase maturation protein FdhE